jgi:hypothetical protein
LEPDCKSDRGLPVEEQLIIDVRPRVESMEKLAAELSAYGANRYWRCRWERVLKHRGSGSGDGIPLGLKCSRLLHGEPKETS